MTGWYRNDHMSMICGCENVAETHYWQKLCVSNGLLMAVKMMSEKQVMKASNLKISVTMVRMLWLCWRGVAACDEQRLKPVTVTWPVSVWYSDDHHWLNILTFKPVSLLLQNKCRNIYNDLFCENHPDCWWAVLWCKYLVILVITWAVTQWYSDIVIVRNGKWLTDVVLMTTIHSDLFSIIVLLKWSIIVSLILMMMICWKHWLLFCSEVLCSRAPY